MIVPGDRVTIAFDPTIARPQPILEVLGQILRESGVEPEDVTVLAPSASSARICERPSRLEPRWSFTIPRIAASWRISPRPSKAGAFTSTGS